MSYRYLFLLFFGLNTHFVNAAIFCPPDKTILCYDDIYELSLTGIPTVIGYPPELARYTDVRQNGICNAGIVERTWYVDVNQNEQLDSGEDACVQKITVQYVGAPVSIQFPPDKQYSCVEDIRLDSPDWVSGACDMIGVSHQDQVFTISGDACFKILRHFTVINWCQYLPGTPGWNGEGIWTHTQVIKVVEESKPVIKQCAALTIGTDAGCEGTFIVRNSADDPGKCGSQSLLWTAEIDLWSDGTVDYVYGFNRPGQFKLDSVSNNEEVVITLPGKIRMGTHKVTWKVRDVCGNNTSCVQYVQLKDLKRPTPYMHDLLTAGFDAKAMDLMVPARLFNINSTDNCTLPGNLRYSFSKNVNDTIRIINCSNAGFQYYTLYVTDMMGNQEFAEVYLLAFDNGSCNNTLTLTGTVTESNRRPMPNVGMKLALENKQISLTANSDESGRFDWKGIGLYKDMRLSVADQIKMLPAAWSARVNIADLKILQDHILGKRTLSNFEWMAADIDNDGLVRARDVSQLKYRILHPEEQNAPWKFLADVDSISGENELKNYTSEIILSASDGSPDFTAVCTGDISGANEVETGLRSFVYLRERLEGEWMHYYLTEATVLEGIQMAVKFPAGDDMPDIRSSYYTPSQMPLCFDASTGILRCLGIGNVTVEEGKPLISVSVSNAATQPATMVSEESGVLLPGYQFRKLISVKNSGEDVRLSSVGVWPNPGNGKFSLSGDDALIMKVSDAAGKQVEWTQTGRDFVIHAGNGIYFLTVKSPQGLTVVRAVVSQ